jgi:hypothetical protein
VDSYYIAVYAGVHDCHFYRIRYRKWKEGMCFMTGYSTAIAVNASADKPIVVDRSYYHHLIQAEYLIMAFFMNGTQVIFKQ